MAGIAVLLSLGGYGIIRVNRRSQHPKLPVCDVCGTQVEHDAERCPKCGADFTNPNREWHKLT